MARVKFYGLLRLKSGLAETTAEARTVSELIAVLGVRIDGLDYQELKNSVIFVNGKNITEQKMYRTSLDGDSEVMFLSPVSGG
ncbi:MAG: MoaD/ThiS family protein [Clostridia bacterium]|nr:MoaD/ThiS family protein [Clostridia bacterium]